MDLKEIKQKANMCLGCKTKPCSVACPMHTDIPEFIEEIKNENIEEAYNILINNNIFSHVCSKICPQENQCEGSCVRKNKGESTQIGILENFVNNWAKENNKSAKIDCLPIKENIKVAIVGGGPAGLSCSYELIKNGIKSVVFEKESVLGGILSYGIPDFRLEKNIIEDIVKKLENLGVEFRLGQALGENLTISKLKEEYDLFYNKLLYL